MASLAPPTAFWILPAVLSAAPSACSLASPVILPAACLMAPLAWVAEPSILSLFMTILLMGFGDSNNGSAKSRFPVTFVTRRPNGKVGTDDGDRDGNLLNE